MFKIGDFVYYEDYDCGETRGSYGIITKIEDNKATVSVKYFMDGTPCSTKDIIICHTRFLEDGVKALNEHLAELDEERKRFSEILLDTGEYVK